MTNQEAKFILSAYRSNGVDANDEIFTEALRQAERDPALRGWLVSEQALDAAMARKLKEIAPPVELRDAILTGARVSGSRQRFWNQPLWIGLGAAAAILIVASVAVWPKQASADTHALAEFALKDLAGETHGGHGRQVEAVQKLLADPSVRLSDSQAINFEVLKRGGCRTVEFGGREVLEICFNRDGKWFHLYAMRAPDLKGSNDAPAVSISQRDALACATWSNSSTGELYAVVGTTDIESVKSLL
jgi:hypothetical protein